MIFKTLNGRDAYMSPTKYRIDWDRVVSGPQKRVKDFLKPYWKNDAVFEEARIPRSLLRIDLLNVSKGIVVEVSPMQHSAYHPFFHGSEEGFKQSLKRDLIKAQWAELNNLTYVELCEEDLAAGLSRKLFKTKYGVTL